MTTPDRALEALDSAALRSRAAELGVTIGTSALSREQLIDLVHGLESGDEEAESVDGGQDREASILPSTLASARLCRTQGLAGEARRICLEVLAGQPGDEEALALLWRLEVDRRGPSWRPRYALGAERFLAADAAAGRLEADVEEDPAVVGVELLCLGPTSLYALWELTEAIDELAARRAGAGAERVLRCHSLWSSRRGLHRQRRDVKIADRRGGVVLGSCRADALHRVQVGWIGSQGRLIPICHSDAAATAASEPARGAPPITTIEEPPPAVAPDRRALDRILARLGAL